MGGGILNMVTVLAAGIIVVGGLLVGLSVVKRRRNKYKHVEDGEQKR